MARSPLLYPLSLFSQWISPFFLGYQNTSKHISCLAAQIPFRWICCLILWRVSWIGRTWLRFCACFSAKKSGKTLETIVAAGTKREENQNWFAVVEICWFSIAVSSSTLKRGSVFLIFFRWQVEATKPVFFRGLVDAFPWTWQAGGDRCWRTRTPDWHHHGLVSNMVCIQQGGSPTPNLAFLSSYSHQMEDAPRHF